VVNGTCGIKSYELNELLGTKLRALYQCRKGSDLFDLAVALEHTDADPDRIVEAFGAFMDHGGHTVTRQQFEDNLAAKLGDPNFIADIGPQLVSVCDWNLEAAAAAVRSRLIERLGA
jgi:predicted nucleotidyltransferase component of viral defense system